MRVWKIARGESVVTYTWPLAMFRGRHTRLYSNVDRRRPACFGLPTDTTTLPWSQQCGATKEHLHMWGASLGARRTSAFDDRHGGSIMTGRLKFVYKGRKLAIVTASTPLHQPPRRAEPQPHLECCSSTPLCFACSCLLHRRLLVGLKLVTTVVLACPYSSIA